MFSSLRNAILEPSKRVLSAENLELVRKWVNYCIEHHPECGNRALASVFLDQAEIIRWRVRLRKELRLGKSPPRRRSVRFRGEK